MLDKVKLLTNNASTFPTNTAALGASNILIHHSRDTESKQWAETTGNSKSFIFFVVVFFICIFYC